MDDLKLILMRACMLTGPVRSSTQPAPLRPPVWTTLPNACCVCVPWTLLWVSHIFHILLENLLTWPCHKYTLNGYCRGRLIQCKKCLTVLAWTLPSLCRRGLSLPGHSDLRAAFSEEGPRSDLVTFSPSLSVVSWITRPVLLLGRLPEGGLWLWGSLLLLLQVSMSHRADYSDISLTPPVC